MSVSSPRRSVFADRLAEYADFAVGDAAVFARRGRWADFFTDRIGPAFDGRIVFEIGCNDGDLLCRMATKHPVTAFVGLDWKAKAVYDAATRVAALGLSNVALLRGRGQDLARVFGPGEVDEILLLHPDPCATPVERPNRLFAAPFLTAAHAVLRGPGATLTLKTDHAEYFADAYTLARTAAAAGFEVAGVSDDYWNDPAALAHTAGRIFAGLRTRFEARFVRKRQPIQYLELRRRPTA